MLVLLDYTFLERNKQDRLSASDIVEWHDK